jgi:glycosyltransferase involved in cell wall biosynthesis
VSARVSAAPGNGRRLLVVTYYFDPNGAVGGLRWLGITKYLTRLGWKVAVVTAAPPVGSDAPGPMGVQVECCPRLGTFLDGCRLVRRLALGRSPGGGRIPTALGAAAPSRPPSLLRQLGREVAACLVFPDESRGWMLRAAVRTRLLIRRFQPHVVVSSGPPHSAHLVAGMATIGSPARWLIDLRDPWAGPYTKAWDSHPKLGSRIFRTLSPRLERLAFRAADGVITNTHQLAQALAARYPDVPVVSVPNGVDPECLPPPAPPHQRYPGLGIVHAGTLYGSRDLGPVVRAFGMFLERYPEAAQAGSKLRIAGQADACRARTFNEAIAASGMAPYVEVLGPLSRAEAQNVVSRSHLAVVLAQEQELQIPAKLYESVAMGIPTLVVAGADSAAVAAGRRLGAATRDPADVAGIACLLEQLWHDRSRVRSPCPAPITYDAIAHHVAELFETTCAAACACDGVQGAS